MEPLLILPSWTCCEVQRRQSVEKNVASGVHSLALVMDRFSAPPVPLYRQWRLFLLPDNNSQLPLHLKRALGQTEVSSPKKQHTGHVSVDGNRLSETKGCELGLVLWCNCSLTMDSNRPAFSPGTTVSSFLLLSCSASFTPLVLGAHLQSHRRMCFDLSPSCSGI